MASKIEVSADSLGEIPRNLNSGLPGGKVIPRVLKEIIWDLPFQIPLEAIFNLLLVGFYWKGSFK
jgi:hypothetical protein